MCGAAVKRSRPFRAGSPRTESIVRESGRGCSGWLQGTKPIRATFGSCPERGRRPLLPPAPPREAAEAAPAERLAKEQPGGFCYRSWALCLRNLFPLCCSGARSPPPARTGASFSPLVGFLCQSVGFSPSSSRAAAMLRRSALPSSSLPPQLFPLERFTFPWCVQCGRALLISAR